MRSCRKSIVKDYFQVHEVLRTYPFNIFLFFLIFGINLLKIHLNILHSLFNLIIPIRPINESFNRNQQQDKDNNPKKYHNNNFLIIKRFKRQTNRQKDKDNDRYPYYLKQSINKIPLSFWYATIISIK